MGDEEDDGIIKMETRENKGKGNQNDQDDS